MKINLSHCRLRNWSVNDVESLVRHANDPRVTAFLRDIFPHPYTHADAISWITRSSKDDLNLAVEVNGEAAGGIGCMPGSDVHRIKAEMGFWIGAVHWGKGIATEAATAFSNDLLDMHGFLRIESHVFQNNSASARVLRKAGFILESKQVKAIIKNGSVMDLLIFVKLKEDCWKLSNLHRDTGITSDRRSE